MCCFKISPTVWTAPQFTTFKVTSITSILTLSLNWIALRWLPCDGLMIDWWSDFPATLNIWRSDTFTIASLIGELKSKTLELLQDAGERSQGNLVSPQPRLTGSPRRLRSFPQFHAEAAPSQLSCLNNGKQKSWDLTPTKEERGKKAPPAKFNNAFLQTTACGEDRSSRVSGRGSAPNNTLIENLTANTALNFPWTRMRFETSCLFADKGSLECRFTNAQRLL